MKPTHRNPLLRTFILAATICLTLDRPANAASIYWDGITPGSWATASNWSTSSNATTPNPGAEPGASDDVIFNISSANLAQITTLNATKNAFSLTFNNTGTSLIRSDSGTTRTLAVGSGGITVNSGAGAVTIGAGSNGNVVSVAGSQVWTNNSSNTAVIYNTIGRSNGSVLSLAGTSTFTASIHALSNSLIGTWVATGSGTSLRYVTKSPNIMSAYSAGTAAADASSLIDAVGTVNYDLANATGSTPPVVSANTIRFTGEAGTLSPGETSFTVKGLMNAGTGKWTIGTNPISIGSTNELVIIANSQETEISSAIQNNGITASAVSYHGGGTLTLSGDNTFTNGLNIGAGKVLVNHPGALNSSSPNLINFNGTSGTLSLNGNNNISVAGLNSTSAGTLSQSSQIVENASASAVNLNIGGSVSSSSFYGTIQDGSGGGSLGITKVGTGTLTLASAHSYSGNTQVNEGILTVNLPSSLSGYTSAGKVIFNGGTLSVKTGNGTSTGWSSSQIDSLLSNATKTSGNLGIDTSNGSVTQSTGLPAFTPTNLRSIGLTKLGNNALTLNLANSYNGATNVSNGVLTIQNAAALGTTTGATTVSTSGRVELDGGITVSGENLAISGAGGTNFFNGALNSKSGVNKWAGNITIGSNDTRIGAQAGSSIEVSGVIDSGANTHLITFRPADTTATVIVSGANTYLGPTTLTGGLVNASSLNSVEGGTESSNFGAPVTIANGTITFGGAEGSGLRYVGTGETTDRIINLGGTTQGGRIEQSGTGLLKFTSAFTATGTGSKTLTLQGSSSGSGEIAGAIVNNANGSTLLNTAFSSGATSITLNSVEGISPGAVISGTGIIALTTVTSINSSTKTVTLSAPTNAAGTVNTVITVAGVTNPTSIAKTGTGTWVISGANSYSGASTVNSGTLKLDYNNNNSSKLSDTAILTLSGGTLELSGGSHTEIVGSTSLTAGTVSTIKGSADGSILQMNAITRGTGASVVFTAPSIATTDATNTNGILGTWATINGTDWAANSTNEADGLITAAIYSEIDAQAGGSGSTIINSGTTTNVRISGDGTTAGVITLGSPSISINTLLQSNSSQSAVVDLGTTDLLQTSAIMIGSGASDLTIGATQNDGSLTSATIGGDLLLRNNSSSALTINSTIADHTTATPSTLTKVGLGTVVLAGTNTYTGATNLAEGTLKAGSPGGFNGTSPLVMTGISTLDLNGHDGAFTNLTATANNNITTTGEGSGIDTLTISGLTATSGALFTDNGIRQLELSVTGNSNPINNVANTFSGGLILGNMSRLTVVNGTVGSPGAITSGPFGRGQITVNGGTTITTGAQIWFNTSNLVLVNDVLINGNAGNGSRSGSFRIGTNANALTGLVISGNINANLTDANFGCDSTSDGSALLLSGKLTGNSGFRFFQSSNAFKWTTTLNNSTNSPNDYSGPTTISSAQTTLALGAADQIPNGTGKGNLVLTSGSLDLAGFNETINGLTGAGIIDNVSTGTSNTLTLGDGNATGTEFSGVIKNTTGILSLVKTGTGTQTLSGVNTYSGTTSINAGTLALGAAGTIDNTASVAIAAGAKLDVTAKTSYTAPATLSFAIDGTAGTNGLIESTGKPLKIDSTSVTVQASGPLTSEAYVLANYGSITDSPAFASITSVPGYTLDYAYNNGSQIALVKDTATPYDTWINDYPSITGQDKLSSADPDKDGLSNQQEFAFGLIPNSGSSVNPITSQLNKTTGQFSYQRKASSGLTYTIWTSTDLQNWTQDSGATQTPIADGANETVQVTLSATKPLTSSKLFARIQAD